jgi:hypothetical protein
MAEADESEVVRASSEQAAWLRGSANELEKAILAAFGGVVGKRSTWWRSFEGIVGSYDMSITELAGEDVVGRNNAANISAASLLKVVEELYAGRAELVGIFQNDTLHLGVAKHGTLPRPLGVLPLLPLIVIGGFTGIAWLTFDIWAHMKKAESEARIAEAGNEARKLELLKKAQAQGPVALNQVSKIIKQIDDSAADKHRGLMDQLGKLASKTGQAIADVGEAAKSSGWGGIAIIGALLFLFARRRGRA